MQQLVHLNRDQSPSCHLSLSPVAGYERRSHCLLAVSSPSPETDPPRVARSGRTMESTATAVDSLLEREILQASNSDTPRDDRNPGPAARLNAVWRQKVVGWYFTVVAALRVRHSNSTAVDSSSGNIDSPSNRASVHVAVSLLDNYLMSLPSSSHVHI